MYAVKITTDCTVELITVPEDHDWTWYPKQIGCRYFEIVHPKELAEPYVMIADEEGLLKPNRLNKIASWLYGMQIHGQPIVGDVLIMMEAGENIVGLEEEDAENIKAMAEDLKEEIRTHWISGIKCVKRA